MGEAKRKVAQGIPRAASKEFSRELIVGDAEVVRRKFRQTFDREIDTLIRALYAAHLAVDGLGEASRGNDRASVAYYFAHTALSNLYTGAKLVVSGHPQAAGQQFRSYAEACAIAMLMTHDGEWVRLGRLGIKYPAHDSLSIVTKKDVAAHLKKVLGLDKRVWQAFKELAEWYNHHAHGGVVAMVMATRLGSGRTVLGGEYDPDRRWEYKSELQVSRVRAMFLGGLAGGLQRHFLTHPS